MSRLRFLAVVGSAVVGSALVATQVSGQVSFPGTGAGAIPGSALSCQSPAGQRSMMFEVTGLTPGVVYDVEVALTLDHPRMGDLRAQLIAPVATAHTLFARVGYSGGCSGDDSDLDGTYTFSDQAGTKNFSTTALSVGSATAVPPGRHRATEAADGSRQSVAGGRGQRAAGGPLAETLITPAFAALGDYNGTWTVIIVNDGILSGNLTAGILRFTPTIHLAVGGSNFGVIPDGGAQCGTYLGDRQITFDLAAPGGNAVGGLAATRVEILILHSWIGDLDVGLIAPNSAVHTLFSRVGSSTGNCFGSSAGLSGLSGNYLFDDRGNLVLTNLWTAATLNATVPAGAYRTTAPGPDNSPPAAITTMTRSLAFSGLDSVQGTWKLRLRDGLLSHLGSITSATLHVYAHAPIFADGFESGDTSAWSLAVL